MIRRILVIASVAVLAFLVLFGLSAGFAAWQAQQARKAAVNAAAEIESFNFPALADDLNSVRRSARLADLATNNPVWAVAGALPVVGETPKAISQTTSAMNTVAASSKDLSELLPNLGADSLRTSDGTINIQTLNELAPASTTLSQGLDAGLGQLSQVETSALPGSTGPAVEKLQDQVQALAAPVQAIASLGTLLSSMFGSGEPRTWLVLEQNAAEVRGTGGIVGGYAVLRTADGKVSFDQQANNTALNRGRLDTSILPEEYGDLWGDDATYWWGMNMSPHFPYTGKLAADAFQRKGTHIDGVVGIDQYATAALLAGTGPVDVNGTEVSSKNAVRWLSYDVYREYPDPVQKDAAVAQLVGEVFAKLGNGKVDTQALFTAIKNPVQDRRITAWTTDPDEQAQLEALPIGGAIPNTTGAFGMVVVNNGGGNKLDSFLKVNTAYEVGDCRADGARTGTMNITVTNDAPSTGLPGYVDARQKVLGPELQKSGSTIALLYIYGPIGSYGISVKINGVDDIISESEERGHPVWRVDVPLQAGQTSKVKIEFNEDSVAAGDSGNSTAPVQPMINPQKVVVVPGKTC